MNIDSRKHSRDKKISELVNEYRSKMLEKKVSRQTPFYWHFLYAEEAVKSFYEGTNISCILTASALIECLLFWEYKRQNPNSMRAGAPLKEKGDSMWKYLQYLAKRGFPIDDLRFKDEKKLEYPSDIKFVETRGHFAHGDLLYAVRTPALYYPRSDEASDYGILEDEYHDKHPKAGFENIAYIQLVKALKFAITFTNYLGSNYPII